MLAFYEFLMAHATPELKHVFDPGPQPTKAPEGTDPGSVLAQFLWGIEAFSEIYPTTESDASNLLIALYKIGQAKEALDDPKIGPIAEKSNPFSSARQVRPDFNWPDAGQNGWPDFLFLLADPVGGAFPRRKPDASWSTSQVAAKLNELQDAVMRALRPLAESTYPDPSPIQNRTDFTEVWYCIRAVMEHPECQTVHPELLSDPTDPFLMAGFFDPDAPARPIRIGLPIDPTPSGLRKFDRNTVFQLSDLMCNQISRMKGVTFGDLVRSVLPWPFHKSLKRPGTGKCVPGSDTGMMLVMSIPIITICAMLLLMIVVALLDMVFKWLPFFLLWIPVRKTADKGKL